MFARSAGLTRPTPPRSARSPRSFQPTARPRGSKTRRGRRAIDKSTNHLASCAKVCPGNDESAGKCRSGTTARGNKWLRATLTEAALSARKSKNSYLAAQYQRLRGRRGRNKAVTAVGQSILTAIWHMLQTGELYNNPGNDYVTRQNPDRITQRLIRQLEALGHRVTIEPQEVTAPLTTPPAAGGRWQECRIVAVPAPTPGLLRELAAVSSWWSDRRERKNANGASQRGVFA
jgi:hypothetical protein